MFDRVKRALALYPNVVLPLPLPNMDQSWQMLRQRNCDRPSDIHAINEHLLCHSSNSQLAKHTVYTHGKTLEATCAEILLATGLC